MATVLISGLGLIGSSIARMIKQDHRELTIIGSDPDDETAQFLLNHQLIDRRQTFSEAAPLADFIILAGPVSVILEQINVLATLSLKSDVLVTDVGSTKETIMKTANQLIQNDINFIGGHPMAGSDRSGSRFGSSELFNNATYFIVGQTKNNRKLAQFQQLLSKAAIHWQPISSSSHDQLVCELSHLPHVIATTLVNTAVDDLEGEPLGLRAAAGGFKDTTRIAAADPTMWTAIMMNNTDRINQSLTQFQQHLAQFQKALTAHDESTIKQFLKRARTSRKSVDERK
ncbi:prephenate dehydrogenase [Lentilactobacillus raoultii]|uniref:Prephenate dehydrogenase n=1 Tax=Lentilactobacillus raoultii TaxID=1987503 RepID=A0ABW3PX43_9LACO|nr:prephenate dehydrogenase/arogenate dehydrogenase family protein [Lentilactobacillus raoultii]